jgi:high-affinity nickel permease
MLSGARFLQLLQNYCADQIQRPTIFSTDNKGLLTRILQRCQYSVLSEWSIYIVVILFFGPTK